MYRVLFTLNLPFIGPFDIYTYAVVLVIGFIIGLTWALKYSKPEDVKPETVMDLSICILIGGIIGARFIHVLINYQEYSIRDPVKIINFREGGLAWYGAVLGAIIGGIIFARISRILFWKLADICSAPVMLGLAIGRIGCFLNGCCYGKPTNLPWGVEFPDVYPPGVSRHPTQIYEALLDIGIFYILNLINKKKKFHGEIFCYFIGLYSIARFIVEFYREWFSSIPAIMHLNLAQITSLLLIIVIIVIGKKLALSNQLTGSVRVNLMRKKEDLKEDEIMICEEVRKTEKSPEDNKKVES
ncbi:MAG TPA: prolipoprotein diacylglyceryl transferase [Candidatus Eremiobacteraeota bacterium]|nr:MAG: Prolipoprotein diacylglyceryl transferase [bacterium ADurb.Bin363]HPZ08009.1 prolipoprotein diacylglyceryl transferase [Candidatus Eremiobacteraeota bacterium]